MNLVPARAGTLFPHMVLRPDPNYWLGWKDFEEEEYHFRKQLPQVRSFGLRARSGNFPLSSKSSFRGSKGSGGIWEFRILELVHKMFLWQVSRVGGSICVKFPHLYVVPRDMLRESHSVVSKKLHPQVRCCVGLWSAVLVGAAVA